MGGRGSKKMTGSLLQRDANQRNQGVNFPGAAQARPVAQSDSKLDVAFAQGVKQDIATWVQKLNIYEEEALMEYQGNAYTDMNAYLHALGRGDTTYPVSQTTKEYITQMTSALQKASLGEAIVVYRGVRTHNLTFTGAQKLIGTTQIDPGFASTSYSALMAREWASGSHAADGSVTNPYVSYRISLPKGARAAHIHAATGDLNDEREITVQRNARYKITGVSQKIVYGDHYVYINAQYIGQAPT